MAPKKTTKKPTFAAKAKAVPSKASAHMHEGDCCSAEDSCCGTGCCAGWGVATRLWWSVAWRTFLWVSFPVMLLQIVMATLANPATPAGLWQFFLMMVMSAPRMLAAAVQTSAFWFFIAVSLYTLVGAIFVYKHLICKGKFFGLSVTVDRDCK